MYTLTVEETFSAAHQLCDYDGPCENLHGHTWRLEMQVSGETLDHVGMLVDFKILKGFLKEERDKLDHKFLNDILEFSPTSEKLAKSPAASALSATNSTSSFQSPLVGFCS